MFALALSLRTMKRTGVCFFSSVSAVARTCRVGPVRAQLILSDWGGGNTIAAF